MQCFLKRHGPGLARTAILLAALCLTASPAPCEPVRVGVYENKPIIFTAEDGAPAGLFVDVLQEVARDSGHSVHQASLGRWFGPTTDDRIPSWVYKALAAAALFAAAFLAASVALRMRVVSQTRELTAKNQALEQEIAERRQAEDSLTAEIMRRRILMDASRDGIAIFNQDHQVVEANSSFAQMLGYSPEEVLRLRSWDLEAVMNEEAIRSAFKDLSRFDATFESRHRRKDGTTYDVEVSARGALVGGEPLIFTVSRDITERKRAEEKLRKSEALLAEVGRVARIGGWEHDLVTGKAVWTRETYRIVEIPEGQEPPGPAEHLAYYHPEDRLVLAEALERAVRTGEPFDLELRCTTAKGRDFWGRAIGYPVFEDNVCVKIFGAFQDITERKQAAEELRVSERHLREVVARAPYPMCITARDQTVIFFNQSFTQTFGYTLQDVATMDDLWRTAYPDPEYRRQVCDAWQKARAEEAFGREIKPQEWRMRCKDGTLRDVQFRMVPLGETAIIAMADLTSFRTLENALRRSRDAAEAANRAKSEFLANMSHEIRTPLNGIMGMLQLMQATDLDEKQGEYSAIAIQSCRRLTRLVGDILDLARVEAGRLEIKTESFDFADAMRSVEQLFGPAAAQKGLKLDLRIDPAMPKRVLGDETRLQQVLNNLVGNALKFTASGRVALEAWLLPEHVPGRPWILFSITDTGMGIPDDNIAHLFDAFAQAEDSYSRQYQGAGLGLSISRRLVSLMGGSICVDSEVDRGTAMYFAIPLPADPWARAEALAPAQAARKRPLPGTGLRVLLAEDDLVSQLAVSRQLEQGGHLVTAVANGEQALAALQRERFDCVFMDIQMPVMDGMEATHRIRTRPEFKDRAEVPIVALTAYAMAEDRDKFLRAGMDGYLAKPVEMQALEDFLAQVVKGR